MCKRAFHDLLRIRPFSLSMSCGCISSSVASLISRCMYPVFAAKNFVSCTFISCSWLMLCSATAEPSISRIYTPQLQSCVSLLRSTRMKTERIGSSETSALKAQTPGDYQKNTIRHSAQGEILKSSFLWLSIFDCNGTIVAHDTHQISP